MAQLGHLGAEVLGGVRRGVLEDLLQLIHVLPLEVGDAEEHLHHRVEVAAVAQVPDACVAGPEQGLQWYSRLLDQLPLANPLVHVYLQLCHRLVRLLHLQHVDAEV